VGKKVAVVDYDASNRCYYEGVDLDATAVLGQNGLAPSETDPQFHQQMVYAVISDTVRRFELALGRPVRWRSDTSPSTTPFHGLLKVYPHAMQEANAFYDPQQRALLFGYFKASDEDAGVNLPGQIVFTCLSHDIIVHESTHAILDGIRSHFNDPTGPDAPAFHEGFADVVALLQHFSFKDSLLETIQRTGGLIHRKQLAPSIQAEKTGPMIQAEIGEDNPIVDLARQFGEAMGNRKALRRALGTPPDPRILTTTFNRMNAGRFWWPLSSTPFSPFTLTEHVILSGWLVQMAPKLYQIFCIRTSRTGSQARLQRPRTNFKISACELSITVLQ
jgi:hypothetical protein